MRPILMLAAAGLVLATAFALSARLWWFFDLFSHFRLQYALAALAFCAAALALRAYPTAAVLAAVAVVHGFAVKDLWLGGGGAAVPAGVGPPLRVASANVLASNPTPGEVLDFVRAADADLAVLVDAQGERWHEVLAAIGGLYPHRAPEGWRDGAPVVLFSRHPIRRHRVVRPAGVGRPYLLAAVEAGDRTVTVAAVHPSSPSPTDAADTLWRNLELAYIAESIEGADRPVIVAGDFNTSPWSPHFRDLLAEAGLRHAANGFGWIATWPRWLWWPLRVPIDHILVKGPIAVAAFARGPEIGSDHYPVMADLRLLGR